MSTTTMHTMERYRLSELITLLGDVEVRVFERKDTYEGETTAQSGLELTYKDHARFETWREDRRKRHWQLREWEDRPGWQKALLRFLGKDYRHEPAHTPGGFR